MTEYHDDLILFVDHVFLVSNILKSKTCMYAYLRFALLSRLSTSPDWLKTWNKNICCESNALTVQYFYYFIYMYIPTNCVIRKFVYMQSTY